MPYDSGLFNGGSGGGGGGGGTYVTGCSGGGGGGAILISTPSSITISGILDAKGAEGGWCYTSALCGIRGGPGGGGAGGMVRIEASGITLEAEGVIDCQGGKGGVRSTDASLTPFGGNGGLGYIVIHTSALELAGDTFGVMIVNDCVADLDNDGDVDGLDLEIMAAGMDFACLEYLASSFGMFY